MPLEPGLVEGDFDPIKEYNDIKEKFGGEKALQWFKSYERGMKQNRSYIDDQFKDKGMVDFLSSEPNQSVEKPENIRGTIITDEGKVTPYQTTPGSAFGRKANDDAKFAQTANELSRSGSMPNSDLTPTDNAYSKPDFSGLFGRDLVPKDNPNSKENVLPPSQQDVDRTKEQHEPNSPLKNKSRIVDDDDGFKKYLSDYQNNASEIRLIGRLGEAGHNLGTLGKTTAQDASYFRDVVNSADQPLKEAMDASKLNDQLINSKVKRNLLANAYDPDSELSKNARAIWKAVVPEIFTKDQIPNFENVSAGELKEFLDDPMKAKLLSLSQKDLAELKAGIEIQGIAAKQSTATQNNETKKEIAHEGNQTKITTAGMKPGAGKGKPLPEKIGNNITNYDSAISLINRINGHLDKVQPGRLMKAQNSIAQFFNVDDPETSEFRSLVGDQLAKIMIEMTGKAATDSERAFLRANNPSDSDSVETFKRKMHNLYDYVSGKRNAYVKNMGASKYDMSDFGDTEPYREPPGQTKTKVPPPPKVGEAVDGHIFLGGNPADPKSWKEQ